MNSGNRNDYIRYRLSRANESLNDALLLIQNNKWNSAINRLYYACFYAVVALLLSKDIETQTHDGARTQLSSRFIKEGLLNKRFGKLYSKLFDYRQKGDYGDLYDHTQETVKPLVEPVREFLAEIEKPIPLS